MPVQTGAVPIRAFNDGPRVTIDTFLQDPNWLPALVFAEADQQFLVDALLRQAGPVRGGALGFYTSTPFYADTDSAKRAEFAEVPVATTSRGTPSVAYVAERALAILISDEMKRRWNMDPLNLQVTQVKNTMVQNWDGAFLQVLLNHPDIPVIPTTATTDWSVDSATVANGIRKDVIAGMKRIATAKVPGQNTAFGFKADTLVLGQGNQFNIVRQDEFNKPYVGNMASENLLFTGKLPNKILGLDVVVSRQLSDDTVIVMQRNTVGAIADELPLQVSALYRDEPRKTMRADVQRASAIAIDQPLAACILKLTLSA